MQQPYLFDGRSSKPPSLAVMSHEAETDSAFVRACLAMLVSELADMVVRLIGRSTLATIHANRSCCTFLLFGPAKPIYNVSADQVSLS
jgi:hypothetical protein